MPHVTLEAFAQRIAQLLMDARDLPGRAADRHILLVSAMCGLDPGASYSEKSLNGELQRWILQAAPHLGIDHVALRRYLVDAGFLTRDSGGQSYRVTPSGQSFSFDPEILAVNLPALLSSARQEKMDRKKRHQDKT